MGKVNPRVKVCDNKDIKVIVSRREQWIHFWLRWGLIWTVFFGAYTGTILFILSYINMDNATGDASADIVGNNAMSGNLNDTVLTHNMVSMPIVFYTTGPPLPPPSIPPSPPPLT